MTRKHRIGLMGMGDYSAHDGRAAEKLGIELVALWTLVSLVFHAVRLAQANAAHDRGEKVVSWLA